MGFQCTRGQLGLIACSTLTYWVGLADLLMATSAWPYMRDVYHGIQQIGMGLGAVAIFLPIIGFWGTLVKKNNLIKFHFYSALTGATMMLTYATYCLIYRGEVGDYVNDHFQEMLTHMPTSDPKVCDCTIATTSASQIQSCKDDISWKVKQILIGLAVMNIITSMFLYVGVVLSMRLLKWPRLTTPVLEGGALTTMLVAAVVIFFGVYTGIGGGWQGAGTLRGDMWGLFMAAATSFVIIVNGICGIIGSRLRRVGIMRCVQVVQIVCICLLLASAIVCLIQGIAIDDKCKDNFESGFGSLRSDQSASFCDTDDLYGVTTNCNSGMSTYYSCNTDSSDCTPLAAYESYCLSTAACCSKLLGQAPQPSLWFCGVCCIYMTVFLVVGFLAAGSKVKEIRAEENMMSSTTEVNKAAKGQQKAAKGQQTVGVKADVKVSSKDDGGSAASGSLTFGGDDGKKSRKKNAHRT